MDGPTEKLILAVQSDLKTLSLETKKRHGWVKDACEEAIAKIRGAGTAPSALPYVTQEALYPVLQGCDTRDPKIVKVCLHSVQKLITGGHVDAKGARSIVETAVGLLEAGLEEIKVLQTVTLLLTTNAVVRGALLAQALVLCFRLYASKDTMTSHAAGATVRQLVSLVFERLESGHQEGKDDAYGLLTDLILLVNGEEAVWLTGVRDLPRPFGLELLESILARFPSVFQKYDDFGVVLKERVCAMVIKLFSPNAKGKGGSGEWWVSVRRLRLVDILCVSYFGLLVTECEIFLSLLVRLLDPDKPTWVRCLALEVLHRLITAPPALANFCRAYDLKPHATNVCRDILNALGAYVQSVFATAPPDPTTSTATPTPPAFYFRGNVVPLVTLFHPSTPKSALLELTEKTEPPAFATSESYGVAISFACLSDFVLSLVHIDAHIDDRDVLRTLLTSTWPGLLAALNLLLEASIDDTITESICDRLVDVATLSGKVGVTQAREATVLSLCVATLPPHYGYAVLKGTVGHGEAPHPISYSEMDNAKQQVVVVGTSVVPSLALPTSLQGTPVMLTRKNLLVTGSVLRLSLEGGSLLLTSWLTVLTTLQHLCWVTGIVAKSSADFIASHVARLGIDSRAQLTSSVHSNSWGESSGYSGGSSSSSVPSSTSPISAGLADLSINAKSGNKKNGGAPSSSGGVMAVVVDFVSCLGAGVVRLIETSVSLDDVSLHHVINALTTLSQEAMEIAYSNREPSLFAVAKLLEVGLVNLDRVEMYWRPLTSHLLEVCRHPHMRMREWGSEAVTFLVRSALLHSDAEDERLVSLLLSPLAELSSIPHNDVRAKELTALSQILHVKGDRLRGSWPLALSIVGDVHEGHGEGLVRAAFQCLQLVVTDYLPVLPVGSLPAAIATVGKFGAQKAELNVALSAVGLTWNIADFLFQNKTRLADGLCELPPPLPPLNDVPPFDRLWLAIFQRLGELCVDERPAVRKSSGQTLFSTIGAHSGVLGERSWEAVLWQVLFPLLEAVDTAWKNARSEKVDGGSGSLLIHHSRNTEHKQWAETHVLVLSGIARIFSSKRPSLLSLPSFPRAWTLLLNFIAGGATSANDEVSFAALKSFQEALTPPFTSSMMTTELWRQTWNIYLDIGAKAVTSAVEGSRGPTQAYLTAYAHLFVALFPALQSSLSPSDLAALNKVFARSLVIPLTAEGASSSLLFSSDSSMSPLQDAVYFAYDTLIQEAERIRDLRKLFPGVILQLINFGAYAVRNVTAAKGIPLEGVVPNCMDFGIRCLREAVRVLADVAKDEEMKSYHEELFSSAVRAFRPIVASRFENAEGAWRQTAGEFFEAVGLMVTTKPQDESFWKELGAAAEELLFWSGDGRTAGAKGWKDDAVDVRVVGMLRDLVFSQTTLPPSFLVAVVKIFHRGSSINEYDGINVSEREEFVRACFSSLLEFVLRGPESVAELVETVEGKRVAVLALLERFQAILVAYKEYVGHNSHIPIARHRLAEMTFVLRAIASLIENLKGADPTRGGTWEYIVELYPDLVAIVGLPGVDAAISTALRDALLAYRDLLSPPPR